MARIIKSRVRAHLLARGESEAFALAEAAKFSGHSLRAGFCTAAAVAGSQNGRSGADLATARRPWLPATCGRPRLGRTAA